MLKFNRDQMRGFALGASTVLLFASVIGTAVAASGKLSSIKVVQGGIKLFVDSKLVIPTDPNGKVVEPFIYDGTTYLPMRALSNALTNFEKPVSWDSATSSIYVGQAPVAAQTNLNDVKTYYGNDNNVLKEERAAFNLLNKTITPFNRIDTYATLVYMLESKYSQINGTVTVPYTTLGSSDYGYIRFYNVDKKGQETLIKEVKAIAGDDPVQVSADLRGVEILKITTPGSAAFYNVTLSGIEQ